MRKTLSYIIIFLLYGFMVHKISAMESYKEKFELVEKQAQTIDSLRDEIQSMNMTLDYQDWIIEQAKDLHPKDLGKIMNQSE